MRRLIALVICGLGIAIALYHYKKKEKRSHTESNDAPVQSKYSGLFNEHTIVFLPIPAMLILAVVK
ncbi:MAG: hypothetical protein ABI480_00495 [Chitinophagaceae bacterium]